MLTSAGFKGDLEVVKQLRVAAYLLKTIRLAQLRETIENVLRGKRGAGHLANALRL
jgi:hypothetical protein